MAGPSRLTILGVTALFAAASPLGAFGWGRSSSTSARPIYAPVYYAPMPVVMMPPPCVPRMPAVAPLPRLGNEIRQPLATPLPAAPSGQSAEPPLHNPKRAPVITESRTLGGALSQKASSIPAGRCRVGFWNVTGRDVTLTIDGQTRALAKDRAVTVDVERAFAWQIDDGVTRTERVPDGKNTFEVIIRP